MADFYYGHGETDPMDFERISPTPDGFFTMKRGDTLDAARDKAAATYPGAVIAFAAEDEDQEE